mmetsp:Transcript_43787/g.121200  ORF Transcript_43787/g.121200 Transcript_43787/m.121200 type:complete len:237 (-) Transcript_43787:152-862(-)
MAFDLGRPLRQVHFAQLLGGGGTGKGGREAVGLLFREARLADAVLLISGLESGGGAHGEGSREEERALALLLHEMARFPGVVALTCASAVPFDAAVHTLSPELVRALKAVVQFTLPDFAGRASLWGRLVPPSCPLEAPLDNDTLARESEGFCAAQIRSCIYLAAGAAVLRAEAEQPVVHSGARSGAGAPAAAHGEGQEGAARQPRSLRMAELLEAVADERGKMHGARDALQQSMVM